MEDQKIYWSDKPREKWGDGDFLTFFLIPNKWWSVEAWKYAFNMRAAMLRKSVMTTNYNHPRHGREGELSMTWNGYCSCGRLLTTADVYYCVCRLVIIAAREKGREGA